MIRRILIDVVVNKWGASDLSHLLESIGVGEN